MTVPPESEVLLHVCDLRTYFRTHAGLARAVDGITLDIRRGECVALVGESGCGKSVTSLTIMRLLLVPPAEIAGGEVVFDGRNLLEFSERQMTAVRGRRIGMIFQEPHTALNPVFTVGEQVAEAYLAHNPDATAGAALERAIEALRSVGIPDPQRRARDYPHQLSGGLKQRVCIAMALVCEPQLLIADEPTTALDVTIQAQILELLRQLQAERHLSLLLITHDLGVVAEMAARTCVMYAGQIVEQAPTADLFLRPLHPYTQGLLRARPELGSSHRQRRRLSVIPGMVPAATRFCDGCRFGPRCPLHHQRCAETPRLVDFGAGHQAACWAARASPVDAWKDEVVPSA